MNMEFKLKIHMGNAAFADEPMTELARILEGLAASLRDDAPNSGTLRDVNGNRVGEWEFRDA